ncbi:hypothetical protein GCM10022226_10040 [Sphaerisporangium flaviroseum]|uniref:HTH cro/C1-type domain-containing protein n=1 Tax=Sphaerisporangium flaviroseum TaxID=509199 RepID=A0ABP7HF22_9ACTN
MSEPSPVEELATYLRHLKNKTGRSYDALAKRFGVGKSTLHRYCSGDSVPPRFTLLEQFAKECQASQAEIIELHQRWVRAHTFHEARFNTEQPVEPPTGRATSPHAPPPPLPKTPPSAKGSREYLPVLRKGRTWWTLAGMAVLILGGVLIWRPGTEFMADAESTHACSDRGGVEHVDARQGGVVWTRDFVCANRPDTPLYLDVDSTEKIAILDTPKSWFVCWEPGGEGRAWYYTRGDRSEPGKESWEGWGFTPADHVTAPTHPVPNMPRCSGSR